MNELYEALLNIYGLNKDKLKETREQCQLLAQTHLTTANCYNSIAGWLELLENPTRENIRTAFARGAELALSMARLGMTSLEEIMKQAMKNSP